MLLTWGFLEHVCMIMELWFRAGDKFLADPINMWPLIDGSKNPDREEVWPLSFLLKKCSEHALYTAYECHKVSWSFPYWFLLYSLNTVWICYHFRFFGISRLPIAILITDSNSHTLIECFYTSSIFFIRGIYLFSIPAHLVATDPKRQNKRPEKRTAQPGHQGQAHRSKSQIWEILNEARNQYFLDVATS